jgi:hypothetical protein
MAYERIKTEMKGTGSRCIPRADAKKASDRLRREADKRACDEGERDIWAEAAENRARAWAAIDAVMEESRRNLAPVWEALGRIGEQSRAITAGLFPENRKAAGPKTDG